MDEVLFDHGQRVRGEGPLACGDTVATSLTEAIDTVKDTVHDAMAAVRGFAEELSLVKPGRGSTGHHPMYQYVLDGRTP